MEWKHTDSGKENVLGAEVSKEGHADMKWPITIDFLEKSSTLNTGFYYQLLKRNLPHLLNEPRCYLIFSLFQIQCIETAKKMYMCLLLKS